jgi:uncharacterized protein (DUF1501 family)
MAPLSRRTFLGLAGGAAGVAVAGGVAWSRLVDEDVRDHRAASAAATNPDRILVVVEMGGGNDGLNTLVPSDGVYRDARPTLALPEGTLLDVGHERYALAPSLEPIAGRWRNGEVAAVQGLAFGGQSRSHFAATDVWHAGGGYPFTTSWLGRWLDATGDDAASPLRAIALGTNTRILAADRSLSTVVGAPEQFRLLAPEGPDADPEAVVAAFTATSSPVGGDSVIGAAQVAIPAALEGVDLLASVTGDGSQPDPTQGQATALLRTVGQIIGLDVGTRVFVVGVGEFDTHAAQPERHPALLADVFGGIAELLTTLEAQGRADDVLVVTTSEFGRRVAENGSLGTDHGFANVQFLLGNAVHGQVVGDLDLVHLDEGDVPMDVETRSLYANALDWLGGPTDEILDGPFDRFDLVAG